MSAFAAYLPAVEEPSQAQLQALALDLLSNVSAATADSSASACLHLWPTFSWSTNATAAAPAAAAGAPAHATPAHEQSAQEAATADQQSLPLHISISRTVPIKRIQIDSLQAALSKQLKPFKACRLQLQGLVCLVNDSATRSFVGVQVAAGDKQVRRSAVCSMWVVRSVVLPDTANMHAAGSLGCGAGNRPIQQKGTRWSDYGLVDNKARKLVVFVPG